MFRIGNVKKRLTRDENEKDANSGDETRQQIMSVNGW